MKCPQCQRENQFPVPGLCPECYRQWKDEMRARFGPGPWLAQHPNVRAEGATVWSAQADVPAGADVAEREAASPIERSVAAVIERLQQPDGDHDHLLAQINKVVREMALMIACCAAAPSGGDGGSG